MWVQDMETSAQDRPSSLQSQPGTTIALPVAFAFSFLVLFVCFTGFEALFKKASGSDHASTVGLEQASQLN